MFCVCVKGKFLGNQNKVSTLFWLPNKTPIKQDLLLIRVLVQQQNFLNCSPLVLLLLKHVIKYCEKAYERSGNNPFWFIKNSGEILDEIKARDFSLSTYDCSTLYTTLPCNLVKDKLIYLIEITFQREEGLLTLHVTTETYFSLQKSLKHIMHGLVKMYVIR